MIYRVQIDCGGLAQWVRIAADSRGDEGGDAVFTGLDGRVLCRIAREIVIAIEEVSES